jgi:hypothetical protein
VSIIGSSALSFLQAVDADWAVISAGHENNHPHPDTIRRIHLTDSKILRTDFGDSMPERSSRVDKAGDDSYIFEADDEQILKIWRVHVN